MRTYTSVSQLERSGNHWWITLDEKAPECLGQARVKARVVINAAGPWVDRVSGARGDDDQRVLGIKGVNVMVRLPESYRGQGLEAFSSKGEPFYVFPWRDFHFIGPTESEFTEEPDTVRVEDREVDYILGEANHLFPDLKLTRSDVQHCWCGVRPTSTLNGRTTHLPVRLSESPGKPDLLTLTGSTIMLHRHAARLIARAVEVRLGKRGAAPRGMVERERIDISDIQRIVTREHVVRLTDLVRRRLPFGLDPDLGRESVEQLSKAVAVALGWSENRRQEELKYFEEDTARVYRQLLW
ncbi:glycerol-3-phosphate dehydrogenase, anaerobic, A subunit [compost metagenome]